MFGIANNLWRLGRNEEAETLARRGIQQYPNVPKFWGILCYALRDSGRIDEALAEAKEMIRLFPKDDRAWGALSVIHDRRGEKEEAVEAARQAYEAAGKSRHRLYRLMDLGVRLPEADHPTSADLVMKEKEKWIEEI